MRYTKTHPWLTFSLNLTGAPFRLWLLLGEAGSKCEHIAGVPLRPDTADRLHLVYLAKGAAATTAIEGNTLTENEVLRHLQGALEVGPSKEYLRQEIDNVVTACNQVEERIRRGESDLSPELIKDYNRLVLEKLALSPEVVPGQIRSHSVVVGNVYRGAPEEDCEHLLAQMCDWLNGIALEGVSKTVVGLFKATLAHLYLAWIHPFGDGNGRTARLVEFQLLLAAGVPTPAAHLLSNHYNQTRSEYYRQLDHASKSGGDVLPFLSYAVQGFVDGLKEQIDTIRRQQMDVAWRNYVHERFHDKTSLAFQRQKHLVLDLSIHGEPVQAAKIPELSVRLAHHYHGKTQKTVQRDLRMLETMNLVAKVPEGYRACSERILAFLPWRKA
jgi:Fic family protein